MVELTPPLSHIKTCASSNEHAANWLAEYFATDGKLAGLDRKEWTDEKMLEWCRSFSKIVNGRGAFGSGIKEGKTNSFSRYIDFADDLLGDMGNMRTRRVDPENLEKDYTALYRAAVWKGLGDERRKARSAMMIGQTAKL